MAHIGLRYRGLVVLAGLALVLTACTGGGGGTGSSSAPAQGKIRYGGTLNATFASDATTLDPAVCYDSVCWNAMQMLFDRLYDYDRNTTNLIPQAASQMPTITNGGTTYTIDIRKGMTFSNGQPVTAKDFVYSFSRILNPKTQSPVQGFWSVVEGASQYAKNPVGTVPGIKAIGDDQLEIDLIQPDSAFVYILAMPQSSVIPEGSASTPGFAQQPIGSGPFTLEAWNPGTSIIFVRNPHYWNYPHPYVDEVDYQIGPSPQVALLQLQKGQTQLLGDPIPSSMFLQVTSDPKTQPLLVKRESLSTYFLTMNVHMKPFDNVLVRRAVAMAIDKSFLLRLVHNQGTTAGGIIPPGVLGYASTGDASQPVDVDGAKKLLAQAGYPNGFTTQLYSWNIDPWTTLDAQIQQDLAKIGVTVEIRAIAQNAFFGLASTPNRTPMSLTFWIADFPEASDFFNALLSCASAVKGGENYSFYCNPKMDSLVNQALAATSESEQVSLYQQAQQLLQEDQPMVPIYHGTSTDIHGASVGGFFAQPIWGWNVSDYWLSTGSPSPPPKS